MKTAAAKTAPIHPPQIQGVGRDLQKDVGDAPGAHLPEEPLQVQGFRGGHRGRPGGLAHAVIDGAHHPHPAAGGGQDGLQEIGGAGLAVGAGDAHQGQLPAGVVVKGGAEVGQGQAGLRHPDHRDPGRRGQLLFGDDHPGALVETGGQIEVAVGAAAFQGHEEPAGGDLPGMVGHPGHRHVHVAQHLTAGQAGQERSQSLGGHRFSHHRNFPPTPIGSMHKP